MSAGPSQPTLQCPGENACPLDQLQTSFNDYINPGIGSPLFINSDAKNSDPEYNNFIAANRFNPPGNDVTGDVLEVNLSDGSTASTWKPGDKNGYSEEFGPSGSFTLLASRPDQVWYNAGNCNGQPAKMPPTIQVSGITVLDGKGNLPDVTFSLYRYSNACTRYSFTQDNTSVGVVFGKTTTNSNNSIDWLNGKTITYSVEASWPDQTHTFFGATFVGGQQGDRNDQVSIVGCEKSCGDGSYAFLRNIMECRCLSSPPADINFIKERQTDYIAHVSPSLALKPKIVPAATSDGSGFALGFSDGEQTGLALLYKAANGDDSMNSSFCSQMPDKNDFLKSNYPQLCSFATLSCKNGAPSGTNEFNMLDLRFKAGSDPLGLGCSLYLSPFHSKQNLSNVCVVAAGKTAVSSAANSWAVDTASFAKDGKIKARVKFNAPAEYADTSPCSGPCDAGCPCKGLIDVVITFSPPTSEKSVALVELTFSNFSSECGLLSDVNILQLATNAVLNIKGDDKFNRNKAEGCYYPVIEPAQISCNDACQIPCVPSTPLSDFINVFIQTTALIVLAVIVVLVLIFVFLRKK